MSQNKDVPLREVLTLQLFFMRIDILTVLPEMIEGMINCSIVKRAQDKGLAEIHLHNLRDYTTNKWRRVDDYPFGGEAGMVMQIEPIDRAISALKSEREYDEVIYTSPDGETLNQPMANSMSLLNNMIILCGHYKGIDYRIREHLITKEISVGDYVLTGGELAAAIITDAVVRLIPGAIGDEQSALSCLYTSRRLQRLESTRGTIIRAPAQDRRMALATSTRAYGTPPAGFIEIAALKNKAGDHPPR